MLNRGGFTLKGMTFTGGDPPSAPPTVNAARMKWFPKKDLLALDIDELNFAKKEGEKKPVQHQNIPTKLTRRIVFQKRLKSLT